MLGLLLFGTNGIIASVIDLSSNEIVLLRSLLGSALLVVLFLLTQRRFTFHRCLRDLWLSILTGVAMAFDWRFCSRRASKLA